MVILGVAVFLAGLLMLYSALSDQPITQLAYSIFREGKYPQKKGN
jgi:hypothetical protein